MTEPSHRAASSRALRALRTAATWVLAASIVTWAGPASAITKEEVITLTKLGISADEIKKAIEKDRTVFTLEVNDILELKKSNVQQDVIKYMLETPRLFGSGDAGAPPQPGVEPGQVEPPKDDKPVEAQETPEERAAREERMRQEAIRLQEEEQRIRAQQRHAYAKGILAKGRSLADQGKFVQSIRTFEEFVERGNYSPDSDEAYLAKFGVANAFVKAGLFQAAAKELVEVLLAGADKPFFQLAFRQLRQLRKKVNYSPPDLERLTDFFVGDFSRAFQDEFAYVLGEFYYDYNNWSQALNFLGQVSNGAKDYAKAQFLKGLVEARNNMLKSAVQSFEQAIIATEENESDPEVRDLAFLALARIAYEFASDYDAAEYYYRKIPRQSYKLATALYERSWVYFNKADYSRALGMFQVLHSAYFDHYLYPELWIMEAATYMNLCHFDSAERALEQWRTDISPLAEPLKQFLLKTVRPEEYYNALVSTVGGKKTYGLPSELTHAVLANVEFYNLYQTIRQIEKEQKIIGAEESRLGPKGAEITDKLRNLRSNAIRETGLKIQFILKEVEATLADYEMRATELEVDLQDEKLKQEEMNLRALSGVEEAPTIAPGAATGGAVAIVGSDTWKWPFEGEYWSDEIGYHRAFIKDQCPRESADTGAGLP